MGGQDVTDSRNAPEASDMTIHDSANPMRPSLSIIVPTYEEADSLPPLFARIGDLHDSGLSLEVIVVDDDSRDGTEQAMRNLALPWARLITRRGQRGLSSAVLTGLRAARGDTMIVMDADLSHPPEAIPAMVAALDQGADFVVGSRYVPGGSTEDGWGVLRWINSKVATVMARPFTTVKDCMSGFLGFRADAWQRAVDLDPVGYKIGLELIVKCQCRNVVEVPIHFSTRQHGESKLTLKVQIQYLDHVLRLLRWKHPKWSSFVPFALIGLSGIGVYAGLLAIFGALLDGLLSTDLQVILAIALTIGWNFLWDRWLAFWYARGDSIWRQFIGFMAVCAVPVAINYFVTTWLVDDRMIAPAAGAIGALIGSAAGVVFNWFVARAIVFRRRSSS